MRDLSKIKYLDSASTTRVDDRVKKAMDPYFSDIFGNASSNHEFGKQARNAVERARGQVARIINAEPSEIIFTSGATESINLAIKGYTEANAHRGNHIITVKTEHKAVLSTCEYLESKGLDVTYLKVDENGLIDLDDLRKAIKESTLLIVIMYVNNEIGIIQPIEEIGKIAQKHNVIFFCDATQAVGKVPVDVLADRIDMLCFSAHKLRGPKGVGILYRKEGLQLTPLIHGGGQENGLRGGTYNTPLIVGMGKACEIANSERIQRVQSIELRRKFIEDFYENNKLGQVNFKEVKRAPHILSISLRNKDAAEFLISNSQKFVASTGSACSSALMEDSHVLNSIPNFNVKSTFRISIA
ncbi:cysteine desulfurase family protein [Robiginitalea biformata]|uniref:cysteine desulfurase n=1 Tax=Robiginitalea biformata (strain ATCC BAA-864 / DSM 15991 / KCTC 12146 / HTCC2501) TaxID=313596 RepID=A4CHS4_ROBBH|nr:cysteine desulfurase family protein [Robiginitalea biformata]EAR16482.1 IscS [Robiginitalea biformata HTCC2501]